MINHISLNGVLKNKDEFYPIRYIEVTRQYKSEDGIYHKDIVPLMMWTKNEKNALFSYRDGTFVAIDGRIEMFQDKVVVIVESIMYLLGADVEINFKNS